MYNEHACRSVECKELRLDGAEEKTHKWCNSLPPQRCKRETPRRLSVFTARHYISRLIVSVPETLNQTSSIMQTRILRPDTVRPRSRSSESRSCEVFFLLMNVSQFKVAALYTRRPFPESHGCLRASIRPPSRSVIQHTYDSY